MMQTNAKQVFYFHADAVSIGGFLEEPFRFVPTPSSAALSSAGGLATTATKEFNFEEGIKAKSTYTFVTGRPIQDGGPWTQRVVSVIEGLDLFGRFTADRLVAQVFIEQPAGGGLRKISFAGSSFTNLRVDGKPLVLHSESALLPTQDRDVDAYNQSATCTPDLAWPTLSGVAQRQGAAFLANKETPEWARSRFGWITAKQPDGKTGFEGYTLCSLVNQVDGLAAGQSFGHCVDIPDFGTIFLAEVVVFPYSVQLAMLRAELCGKPKGHVSCCIVIPNGATDPPN
jgi:hypothetical protein